MPARERAGAHHIQRGAPAFPGWLKLESNVELDLPRQAAARVVRKELIAVEVLIHEAVDHAEIGVRGNRTGIRPRELGGVRSATIREGKSAGIGKLGMVEDVEDLRAQLHR